MRSNYLGTALGLVLACLILVNCVDCAVGQDAGTETTPPPATEVEPGDADGAGSTIENMAKQTTEKARQAVDQAKQKVDEFAGEVDKDVRAMEARDSILSPIYSLAETLSFSAFHWLAFTIMTTGVVSFALQLVLGKLVALAKFGFSVSEILSDALGLVISLIGLVLTTQAATENSTFPQSAFAVLSATLVGLVLGIVFYLWGQRQELEAIEARRKAAEARSE